MGDVAFLAIRQRARGSVRVVGSATGLTYVIGPVPTPVSVYDLQELLEMEGDPCCGSPPLPDGRKVKFFGKANATTKQQMQVSDRVRNATLLAKSKPVRSKVAKPKKVEKTEPAKNVKKSGWQSEVSEMKSED